MSQAAVARTATVVGVTPPDGDGVTWARLARF